MITKQSFVMLMKAIEDQMAKDRENGKLISKMGDPEMNNFEFVFTTPLIQTLITALQIELGDNDAKWSDISWWIYDVDFGRNAKNHEAIIDGRSYYIYTAHQLYDFITAVKQ